MDGPDGAPPAADAAAAAAARRARILARGQDRLASISGAAAGTKRPPSSAAPVQPPSHHAQGQAGCEQAAAGVQGQQPPAQEAVRAEPSGARPSPGGAAAVLEAVPVASTSRGVQGASAECMPPPVASQLRSRSTAAAAAAEAQRATSPASTSWAGAAGGGVGGSVDGVGDDGAVAGCAAPAAPAQAPLPPCKWAALNASVRVSRLLRYLAVLWYARALAQGQWALLPPVVVVVATQVALIVGVWHLLSSDLVQERWGPTAGLRGEVEIPRRLRGFDLWSLLLGLSPELRVAASGAAAAAALAKAVWDGLAVFLVAYVIMAGQRGAEPPA